MDPKIADFIARNQHRYTREAIRQQLIEAGHDPADIDATWAILDTPDPDEAAVAGPGFWPRFFLFLVGLNAAVFLVVALSTGMFVNLAGGGGALAGIFGVALAIGALIAWGIVAAVGPEKLGRTTALVLGGLIPLLFAFLIGGSCFALASAIGPPPPPPVNGELELQVDAPSAFQATGPASCQPVRRGVGYFVYASGVGRMNGRPVYVSVEAFESSPGQLETLLSVSAEPSSETDLPPYWSTTPSSRVDADVASDGLSGTIAFENLAGEPGTGASTSEPLSGTISWACR